MKENYLHNVHVILEYTTSMLILLYKTAFKWHKDSRIVVLIKLYDKRFN